MNSDKKLLPIGVFDSGIGGISVLAEIMTLLPNEKFVYLADAGNAPYGIKNREQVREISLNAAKLLASKGVKAMVVACNTATSAGINDIRSEMDFPVIGMEPALKPAVEISGRGTILVMATPLTLQENKFNNLLKRFNDESTIIPVPCPGLMELIESEAAPDDIKKYLRLIFSHPGFSNPSSVVLGCTHYCFVSKEISEVLDNGVNIVDGNLGTARQLLRILEINNLLAPHDEKKELQDVEILATGDTEKVIPLCRRFLTKALLMQGK